MIYFLFEHGIKVFYVYVYYVNLLDWEYNLLFVLFMLFLLNLMPTLWLGDSAIGYHLDFQDPTTITIKSIYLFNLHFLFVITVILIVVGWLLFSVFFL